VVGLVLGLSMGLRAGFSVGLSVGLSMGLSVGPYTMYTAELVNLKKILVPLAERLFMFTSQFA